MFISFVNSALGEIRGETCRRAVESPPDRGQATYVTGPLDLLGNQPPPDRDGSRHHEQDQGRPNPKKKFTHFRYVPGLILLIDTDCQALVVTLLRL
jgi:hypothetical protein